jgi:hypothetical protein
MFALGARTLADGGYNCRATSLSHISLVPFFIIVHGKTCPVMITSTSADARVSWTEVSCDLQGDQERWKSDPCLITQEGRGTGLDATASKTDYSPVSNIQIHLDET